MSLNGLLGVQRDEQEAPGVLANNKLARKGMKNNSHSGLSSSTHRPLTATVNLSNLGDHAQRNSSVPLSGERDNQGVSEE